jgi:hypothetical protein
MYLFLDVPYSVPRLLPYHIFSHIYMLVPKRANCQYRYGAAHHQYWYQF